MSGTTTTSVSRTAQPYTHIMFPHAATLLPNTSAVSTTSVTGPSLTNDTRMCAPNRPSLTVSPCARNASLKASHTRLACSGSPAAMKLGLLPLRMLPYNVNCEIERISPLCCVIDSFMRPSASSNTRSLAILPASQSISSVRPYPRPRQAAHSLC